MYFLKNKNIIFDVLLVIVIIFLLRDCSIKNKTISDKDTLLSLNKYAFDTLRNSKGELEAKQKANIFNHKKEVAHLLDSIESINNIKQQVKVEVRTVIVKEPIEIVKVDTYRIDESLFIKLPLSLYREKEWYKLGISINEKAEGVIDSLIIINTPSFYYGYEKWKIKNLFEKRQPTIVYKDKNPYIQVESIENIIIKEKRKPFSFGIQAGYGITNKGLSPYIGIGGQYNLK